MMGEINNSAPVLAVASLSVMPLPPPQGVPSGSLLATGSSYRSAWQDLTRLLSGIGSRFIGHPSGTTPTSPKSGRHSSSVRMGIEIVPHFVMQSRPGEGSAEAYRGDADLLVAQGRRFQRALVNDRGLRTVFRLLSSDEYKRILIVGMNENMKEGLDENVFGCGIAIASVSEKNARKVSQLTGVNDVRDGDALLWFSPKSMSALDEDDLSTAIEHELWHPHLDRSYPEMIRHVNSLRRKAHDHLAAYLVPQALVEIEHLFLRNEAWRRGRKKFVVRDIARCIETRIELMSSLFDDGKKQDNMMSLSQLCLGLIVEFAHPYRSVGRLLDAFEVEDWILNKASRLAGDQNIGHDYFYIAQRHAANLYRRYFDEHGNPLDSFDTEAIWDIFMKMEGDLIDLRRRLQLAAFLAGDREEGF